MTAKRNAKGWLIPREGTKNYQIYQLLMMGYSSGEIIHLYKENPYKSSIYVLVYNIRNPDRHNESQKKWRKNNPNKYKRRYLTAGSINNYSGYVRKLVKILGISYTEAVELEREFMEKSKCGSAPVTASDMQLDT